MPTSKQKLLGHGILFPLNLDNGSLEIGDYYACIESSINNILGWPKHTKFFRNADGCNLFRLLNEPDDEVTLALAKRFINDALEIQERRIYLLDVLVLHRNSSQITMQLTYQIKETQEVKPYTTIITLI